MTASRGVLQISLSAVQKNYNYLKNLTPVAEIAPVVKANAYGLGMADIAPALAQIGAKTFFVAYLEEGVALRALLPQVKIFVLNGIADGQQQDFLAHRLVPIVNDAHGLALWQKTGENIAVHVDTGLNRLGFNADEFKVALAGQKIDFVMSHLACADTPLHPMNAQQQHRFEQATSGLKVQRSLAASDGIFCGESFHYDMVRPGGALYGLRPTSDGRVNPMQRVVSLQVPVLQFRTVAHNGTVGYGASQTVRVGQRLATVALGYADGFSRSLSNCGKLFYQGQALPVLGRVSMDVITVDVSALQETALRGNMMLDVFSDTQSPDDLAVLGDTIGYEILTLLGRRFERVVMA